MLTCFLEGFPQWLALTATDLVRLTHDYPSLFHVSRLRSIAIDQAIRVHVIAFRYTNSNPQCSGTFW
ncbi:hypothetical protein D3C75_1029270 [compost metagenome]